MNTSIVNPEIEYYAEKYSSVEENILSKIRCYTLNNFSNSYMMSSILQGKIISIISKILCPNYILELGTYTGYTTICLAQGLQSNGKMITIDINSNLNYWLYNNVINYKNNIEYHNNNAKNIINKLHYLFDLVYVDINKKDYIFYYENILPKMKNNGIIIFDNVLWKGTVIKKTNNKITKYMQNFNLKIKNDKRVDNILLPIRDGLMIARKI